MGGRGAGWLLPYCVRETRTHPKFISVSVYKQEILRFRRVKTADCPLPPGLLGGSGPHCRSPRFRVRMLRHSCISYIGSYGYVRPQRVLFLSRFVL